MHVENQTYIYSRACAEFGRSNLDGGRSADEGALTCAIDEGLFADEPGLLLADDGGRFIAAEPGLDDGFEPGPCLL